MWRHGSVGFGRLKPYGFSTSLNNQSALQTSANGMIIVADARLTNRTALLNTFDLPNSSQSDFSDEALILQSYERWGQRCPRYLSGEFAFAIWDSAKRQLFCARDHMGIKPFFYSNLKNTFVFSSRVKGIRVLDFIPIELNEHNLAAALFLTKADKSQTYFMGIRRLRAAHTLEVHDKQDRPMAVTPFWSLQPKNHQIMLSDQEYADAFREIIVRSVCKRLDKAGTTGVMLSGGLDSSAIACIAAQQLRKRDLPLFSVSSVLPENHGGIESDERDYIKQVAKQELNIISHHAIAEGADPFQNLESKFDRFSEPVNAFHYMDEAIANTFSTLGVKRVLSGFHGDTFASYDGRDSLSCLIRQLRWGTALNCILDLKRVQNETIGALYRNNIFPWLLPKFTDFLEQLKLDGREAKLSSPAAKPFSDRFHENSYQNREFFQTSLMPCIAYGSPSMEYQTAEYASLDMNIRFPYWDKELVEFMINIPPEQFIVGGFKRSLFRRAMNGILPETVRQRNTKHPYTPDFHRRVISKKKEIRQYLNDIESDRSLMEMISFYIDTDTIRKKIGSIKPAKGRADWETGTQSIVVSGIILIRFLVWMGRL